MRRDQLAFLIGGFAFGVLVGLLIYDVVNRPVPNAPAPSSRTGAQNPGGETPAPSGSAAAAPSAGAPMMEEIAKLRTQVEQHPDDLVAMTRLANIYHDVSMWDQAIEWYGRAMELSPDDPDLITDLGTCYQGKGESVTALEHFIRANEVAPDHWQSLFNVAVVGGLYAGRFDLAEDALRRLEEMNVVPDRLPGLRRAVEEARAAAESRGDPS